MKYLDGICSFGPRPACSESNRAAADYIAKALEGMGWAVTRQTYAGMDWLEGEARLTVNGNALQAWCAPYGSPCDVSGGILRLETVEQLEAADLRGKIVLAYGELVKEALSAKRFPYWNPPEHQHIVRLLEEGQPAAILSDKRRDGYNFIEDGDFAVPCALIQERDAHALQNGARGTLKMTSLRREGRGVNVIATRGEGARVCVTTHFDTKGHTVGALDNASGVAALMALAERLPKDAPYQVELAFIGCEDSYDCDGEELYIDGHDAQNVRFAVNVDGVGIREGKTSLCFLGCGEELQARVRGLMNTLPGFTECEPWYQGDQTVFAMRGIPTMAISSERAFGEEGLVMHTDRDLPALVDEKRLSETTELLLALIR